MSPGFQKYSIHLKEKVPQAITVELQEDARLISIYLYSTM